MNEKNAKCWKFGEIREKVPGEHVLLFVRIVLSGKSPKRERGVQKFVFERILLWKRRARVKVNFSRNERWDILTGKRKKRKIRKGTEIIRFVWRFWKGWEVLFFEGFARDKKIGKFMWKMNRGGLKIWGKNGKMDIKY